MTMTRGLFLDLDGTMADSLGVMRRVYQSFLDHFDATATDAEFDSLNGPPLKEVVRRLKERHGLDDTIDDLLITYRAFIVEAYDTVEPSAGVRPLLDEARRKGWVIGVVTSNDETLTRRWLQRCGLEPLIDVLVCGGDVAVGKPSPEPYLLALKRADCVAQVSVAVEDSAQGSQSAVNAGLRTFGFEVDPGQPQNWPQGVMRIGALNEIIAHMSGESHA